MSISEQNGSRVVLGCCLLKPQQAFINSLSKLIVQNIFEGYVFPTVSLLPHARNIICAKAYEEHPDFTHLLFIDDDMTFTTKDVLKLYEADKEVISGLTVTRKPPYKIVASLDPFRFKEYIEKETVVNVAHVGMAFTLIKREVLDAVRQDSNVWFTMDREPRVTFNDEWDRKQNKLFDKVNNKPESLWSVLSEAMKFGREAHLNSELPGEDIAFSKQCQKLKIEMYVHCGVLLGHVGERVHEIEDALDIVVP